MYGNVDDNSYGQKNNETIKERSIANLIGIVNTAEVWQTISEDDKKNIIQCLAAYAKGSAKRIMEEEQKEAYNIPVNKFM